MKISEIFNLNKTQAELDFVNIDTRRDIPLFLDPFFLGLRVDNWSIEARSTLQSFFQHLINLIRDGAEIEAKRLFDYLHEPNYTCLGLSNGEPEGNGVGSGDTGRIYESLLQSRAIQTGLVQDIEDNVLFVDNFGKDKLSDMTTNIIKAHLLEYTQSQCLLHNIPLSPDIPLGFCWSGEYERWDSVQSEALVVDQKPILLVPKGIVSFSKEYAADKYYNGFVLDFLQHEHLRMGSALVKKRRNGDFFVTKKDLKERYPQSKELLRTFTLDHPEVLEKFKRETTNESLKNIEITDLNIGILCTDLGQRLVGIPTGNATASDFHNLIIGILHLLFYPYLIYPKKEAEIHEGRKRIDIRFDNAAKDGLFFRFSNNMNLPSSYIFIECKNYSSDPANEELDQLSGRFSVNRGRVGFLVARTFQNKDLFIQRCRDTYSDGRGLIIPLDDQDLINLLDNHNEFNSAFLDQYLSNIVRQIAAN